MVRLATAALTLLLAAPPATAGSPHDVATTGLSPAQVEVVTWALERFADAGLDLPPVRFVAHAGTVACHGFDGYHRFVGGRSVIDLCGPFDRVLAEPLYLHELAHAWDAHALPDHRRQAFLRLRGASAWRGGGLEWHDQGAEQAAEIVAWGVRDRPTRVGRIEQTSCAELLAGYVLLTGRPPLHRHTTLC